MIGPIGAGGISCVATFISAPFVRRALVSSGSMDVPNHRSSHTTPVPRGGGIACSAGVALGLAVAPASSRPSRKVALGLATLALTGLADDQLGNVHFGTRLGLQTLSGGLFAPTLFTLPASSFVTTALVNIVNFMDGINGMSGGTAVVWGVSSVALGRTIDDSVLTLMGAVTAGAGLGFVPWNAPTAHLFLGDVGSYLLGGLMSAAISRQLPRPSVVWLAGAPLIPYGADAAQALIRRHRAGEKLTEAHREHTYQKLVDSVGLTHLQVAYIHAAAASGIALAARAKPPVALPVMAIITGAYLLTPRVARQFRRKHPATNPIPGHFS